MYMPTKKKQQYKKKSHKKQHSRRNQINYFIGGTCSNCGNCMQAASAQSPSAASGPVPAPYSIFKGGKKYSYKKRTGGNDAPPSYAGLPLRYVYGQNDYMKDPSDPAHQTDSRLLQNMTGGKKRQNKTAKKGGSLSFSYLNGQLGSSMGFNPLYSVGESAGSMLGSTIISGTVSDAVLQNPSVFSQPVNSKYNIYNRPMA
jgi:hypothetical protein